jgi:CubicO group peptidase (beta-lactamase class C family)
MMSGVEARPPTAIDPLAKHLVPATAPAGQLVVDVAGSRAFDIALGAASDNDGTTITPDTLFDLASVTKLFTAIAVMRLVEAGAIELDGSVAAVLPDVAGRSAGAKAITWRYLLSHASGLPAGVDLPLDTDPDEARARVLAVRPDKAPGPDVVYSDVGFMVLGFGLEGLTGGPLSDALRELVIEPLGLRATTFRPDPSCSIAPTEFDAVRGRRLRGEVHDENAAALGGVAGHAGLFGTAGDLARLGEVLLAGGGSILSGASLRTMTRRQAATGSMRRGLGFSLWSPDPEATSHPFGRRSFGHTGFTGTSLWVDRDRRLVVALLTNAVARGRDFDAFFAARLAAHREIVAAADPAGRPSREEAR